jgi:hypothetical protein
MGAAGGPNAASSGLVFAADAFNRKGISPLGNDLFNTAPSVIKNIVSPSEGVQQINGVYVGNLTYYTAFSIDYPEGSYGGDAAGRDGITSGLNVRGGSKIFDFGRALNYAVYDNITQAWVKTTVYDSYVGSAAVDTFVSEYATAVAAYPNAIHIVAGSHRDSYHTTAQYNILKDLGAPSNVESLIGFSSPEWILVGKPGLGTGNAYGWVFQNYPTNSDFVAHLNFGLPIYGTKDNYFSFDGTNDYVVINSFANQPTTQITCEAWIKPTKGSVAGSQRGGAISAGNSMYLGIIDSIDGGNTFAMHWANQTTDSRLYNWNGSIPNNAWTHIAGTYNGSTSRAYVNGVEISSWAQTGNIPSSTYYLGTYGYTLGDGSHNFQGQISNAKIYNRGLSGAEILQNYESLRKRFGV